MAKPHTISWPLNPAQVAAINDLLDRLWASAGDLPAAPDGALLYRSGGVWVALEPPTADPRYLRGGRAPSWAQVDIDAGTSGQLPASRVSGLQSGGLRTRREWGLGPGSTTVVGYLVSPSAAGASIQHAADGGYAQLLTGATAGSAANTTVLPSGSQLRFDGGFRLRMVLRSGPDVTSVRYWAGLTSAAFTNSDTPTGNVIAVRYSTVAGDAGWVPYVRGSAGGPTIGTAIGTMAASTRYQIDVRCEPGASTIYFAVNGSAEQAISASGLLTATDLLNFDLRVITQVAASRSIWMSWVHCEQGQAAL